MINSVLLDVKGSMKIFIVRFAPNSSLTGRPVLKHINSHFRNPVKVDSYLICVCRQNICEQTEKVVRLNTVRFVKNGSKQRWG